LEQTFDVLLPVNEELRYERLTRELQHAIRAAPPKETLFNLWTAEKKRMSEELSRFSEDRYRDLVDEQRLSVWKY
jgi:hypothetical protein